MFSQNSVISKLHVFLTVSIQAIQNMDLQMIEQSLILRLQPSTGCMQIMNYQKEIRYESWEEKPKDWLVYLA